MMTTMMTSMTIQIMMFEQMTLFTGHKLHSERDDSCTHNVTTRFLECSQEAIINLFALYHPNRLPNSQNSDQCDLLNAQV